MSTYNGPAVLILEDGTEFPVVATLSHVGNHLPKPGWEGELDDERDDQPNDERSQVWWDIRSQTLELRLPSGASGKVWVKTTNATGATVGGTGVAPF